VRRWLPRLLGKIDAIEVTGDPRKVPLLPWVYRLWDAGFLVPLVGASGKDSNRGVLGSTRTYADVSWRAGAVIPPFEQTATNGEEDNRIAKGRRTGGSSPLPECDLD